MIKQVSFCIIGYGRSEKTIKRCIESICSQNIPDYEILVCGPDGKDFRVRYLNKDTRVGDGAINRMRNYLSAEAAKEFIVLTDPEIEFESNWYNGIKYADCLDIISSRLVTRDNRRGVDWACKLKLGNRTFDYPLQYDEWTTKAYVSGALIAIRKSVWEILKFSESLPAKEGAVDFCLRASSKGFRVGVFPEAVARILPEAAISNLDFDESLIIIDGYRKAFASGRKEFNAKNFNGAIKHFKKSIKFIQDPGSYSYIGWSYYYMAKYEAAVKAFDISLSLEPTNHYALRGRGWVRLEKCEYESAIQDLSRALELIKPNEKDAWIESYRGLGWSYHYLGRFEESIRTFNKCFENKDSADKNVLQDVYSGLGWCYYRNGAYDEALKNFEVMLVNTGPDDHGLRRKVLRDIKLAKKKGKGPSITAVGPVNSKKFFKLRNLSSLMKRKIRRTVSRFLKAS